MTEPIRDDAIYPNDIAGAIMGGLRVDHHLVIESFELKPSVGIVAKDIDRLGLAIQSFKEPLTRAVKEVIIPSIRQNFEEGGRPAWESLSEATVKLRGGDAWPILVRSGKLLRGATSFDIWDVGQTSATLRRLPQDVWYGYVHQAGYGGFSQHVATAQKKLGKGAKATDVTKLAFKMMDAKGVGSQAAVNIPQRQFVMLQDEDVDAVEQIFEEWLTEQVVTMGRMG